MGTAPSTAPRGDDTGTAPRGSDYTALSRQIRSAGLLARRPGAYAVHIGVTLAFYLATCAAVVWVGDSWYQMILARSWVSRSPRSRSSPTTAAINRSSPDGA